jgi:DNA-binding GntR family transcriptional regulator
MTPLQAPRDHQALLDSIRSRDDTKIRAVFSRVFDDGRRVVASAVEEDTR